MNNNNWIQMILTAVQILAAAAMPLIIWWNNRPKLKTSPKIRLIRKEGQIQKVKLRQKWELEHLEIEKQTILKEIAYETEKLRWESGLGEKEPSEPKKENISGPTDLFSGLKQQGASLFQNQVDQAKQTVGSKVNQFSKVAGEKIDEITKIGKPKKEE